MAELTPQFSANRMMREYVDRLYLTSAKNFLSRTGNGAEQALHISNWRDSLRANWHKLRFGSFNIRKEENDYVADVTVYLDDLDISSVQVQVYAAPQQDQEHEIHIMNIVQPLIGTAKGYLCRVRFPASRPEGHYTPRIIPYFEGVGLPLEENNILWLH